MLLLSPPSPSPHSSTARSSLRLLSLCHFLSVSLASLCHVAIRRPRRRRDYARSLVLTRGNSAIKREIAFTPKHSWRPRHQRRDRRRRRRRKINRNDRKGFFSSVLFSLAFDDRDVATEISTIFGTFELSISRSRNRVPVNSCYQSAISFRKFNFLCGEN